MRGLEIMPWLLALISVCRIISPNAHFHSMEHVVCEFESRQILIFYLLPQSFLIVKYHLHFLFHLISETGICGIKEGEWKRFHSQIQNSKNSSSWLLLSCSSSAVPSFSFLYWTLWLDSWLTDRLQAGRLMGIQTFKSPPGRHKREGIQTS